MGFPVYNCQVPKLEDLTGRQFGRLAVVRLAEKRNGRTMWQCRCECGTVKDVQSAQLKGSRTTSCGCQRSENMVARNLKHGMGGKDRPPEFTVWLNMRTRCFSPSDKKYADYGGRGITVEEPWASDFAAFYRDMGPRPARGYEIDRINNDGNYKPGNCRWVPHIDNVNNRRNSAYVEWRGEKLTIAEWSKRVGISDRTIWMRLNKLKWDVERTMTQPLRADRRRKQAA